MLRRYFFSLCERVVQKGSEALFVAVACSMTLPIYQSAAQGPTSIQISSAAVRKSLRPVSVYVWRFMILFDKTLASVVRSGPGERFASLACDDCTYGSHSMSREPTTALNAETLLEKGRLNQSASEYKTCLKIGRWTKLANSFR